MSTDAQRDAERAASRTGATPLRLLVAVFAALILVLTACGSDGSSTEDASGGDAEEPSVDGSGGESSGEVQDGGSSTVIQFADAQSLDPSGIVNSPTQGSTALNAIFDVLFTVDAEGELTPGLATDFSTDDGLTWTMTLQEGVTFTDGTPFDAEAVKAQWELISGQLNSAAAVLGGEDAVVSMEAIDELTFEITFAEPNFQFHQAVQWSSLTWIPSPTAVAEKGADFGNDPVGAGPFMLQSRTPGSETVLERNPDYWQEGLPKLDTLTITTVGDVQQGYDTVVGGQADAFLSLADQFAVNAEADGLQLAGLDNIGGSGYLINNQAPFDDARAREAVWLAMDMDQLNEEYNQGAWDVPTNLFPESSPFHDPANDFPEADAVRAQELLDELAAEGNPVSFAIATTATGEGKQRSIALQTQLATFDNLEVSIRDIDPADYGITLFSGDFQMALYGFGGVDPEPQFASLTTDYLIPIANFESQVIDDAVQAGRATTDVAERQAAYDSLAAEFNELFRMRFSGRNNNWVASRDTVAGARQYGQGSVILTEYGQLG